MSQPNTLEQFCQLLDATDTWSFEGEELKMGELKEPRDEPSTKSSESNPAGDDNDDRGKKRGRYTERQIQGLQASFEEYHTPNPMQRDELSRKIGLTPLQIRHWCEKRRRKLKNQHKDLENVLLRAEVEKLRAENMRCKNALGTLCVRCSGETTTHERYLTIENDRLKDDMDMIFAIASKYDKESSTSASSHLPSSSHSTRQSQAQSSPIRSTPIPSEGKGVYHPEWSYFGDELAIMTKQFNTQNPEP